VGLILVDPGARGAGKRAAPARSWGWRVINAVFPDELHDDAPVTLAAMRELRAAARPFPDVPVVVLSAARGFPRRFRARWTRLQAALAAAARRDATSSSTAPATTSPETGPTAWPIRSSR
jgi:hypothetical protein